MIILMLVSPYHTTTHALHHFHHEEAEDYYDYRKYPPKPVSKTCIGKHRYHLPFDIIDGGQEEKDTSKTYLFKIRDCFASLAMTN
jgi:hypothetical protein